MTIGIAREIHTSFENRTSPVFDNMAD